jgi:DNA-binding SARP family transcriptional activator
LLVAVPIALAAGVGWPLPTVVPNLDEVRNALSSGAVADHTVLKAVALVVWIAWAQVAASAVSEIVAVARRRTAEPTPLTIPGVQLVVGRLLSTALLLGVLVQPRMTSATPARLVPMSAGIAAPVVATTPVVTTAGPTWTVQPRETLWGIAERALGDGRRYEEIANLNRGRLQPDGTTFESPNTIRPGWKLLLPGDARHPSSKGEHTVEAGESLSEIAAGELGDLDRWPELWDLNRGRPQPDGKALTDPDLIEPGWSIALPSSEAPAAAAPTIRPAHAPPVTAGPAPTDPVAELSRPAMVHAGKDSGSHRPVAPLLAGSAAAAVLAILERRRRGRWRHRRRHEAVPVDAPEREMIERRLREAAAKVSSNAEGPVPDDSIGAPPAPESPLVVSIGEASESEVLVDLEALGVASVHGEPHQVAGMLRAVALSLESRDVEVLSVGLRGDEDSPTWDEALGVANAHATAVNERLSGADPAEARSSGLEGVDPLVLVGLDPPEEVANEIEGLAPGVVVLVGGAEVGERITLDDDGLSWPGVDERVDPSIVGEAEAAAINSLLESAVHPADEGPLEPLPSTDVFEIDLRDLPQADDLVSRLDVFVRVFGPVGVVRLSPGEDDEPIVLRRQKSLEVIAYLACRERNIPVEDVRNALWPSGASSLKTLQNMVTETRSALGVGRDGEALLPLPDAGSYRLSTLVGSDYDVFRTLVGRASELPDVRAEEVALLLEDALGLVLGEPFVGAARSYAWVTHQRGALVAEVVDAAEELAEIRLAEGDWRAAEWAARQGLRAFPCDERLHRILMRAAHCAGNTAAVQRVFDELCAVVADPDLGVEPEDTVHPETFALLEDLLGGRSSATQA